MRWTLNALITAEELGVTSKRCSLRPWHQQPGEINRLLGTEGQPAKMLGLDADWAQSALSVGNYGEIFEANIGESTAIGLAVA